MWKIHIDKCAAGRIFRVPAPTSRNRMLLSISPFLFPSSL